MKKRTLGWWIAVPAYLALVMLMYVFATPEIAGSALKERDERSFHVAALRLKPERSESKFAAHTLADVKSGKVDRSAVTFLLPDEPVEITGGDIHTVTVLERQPDRQLVEYRYGNTHDSVSRYRAFKDRVEPVSFRVTMHPGIVLWAFILLIPAWLLGVLINYLTGGRRTARP